MMFAPIMWAATPEPSKAMKSFWSWWDSAHTWVAAPKYRPDVGASDLGGDAWPGGFFCPCHGSKFDLSGRVYKSVPAPSNLEIPPYRFETDSVIVIGEDQEAA